MDEKKRTKIGETIVITEHKLVNISSLSILIFVLFYNLDYIINFSSATEELFITMRHSYVIGFNAAYVK